MYSVNDLQKLVQMLSYLGISPGGTSPPHAVVIGGGTYAAPGTAGYLLASNGASADPSFQSLTSLGIQSTLTLPLSIGQGGTGQTTAAAARAVLGAQAALGFTPVQQGGGIGQSANKVYIGWSSGGKLKATVDVTDLGNIALESFVTGRAPLSILDFGGDNTGSTDNTAALTAVIAANIGTEICVYFPPGKYAFSAQYVYSLPAGTASISLFGAGRDVTNLVWAAGGGLKINFNDPLGNSAHISDLSIETGTANVGDGLYINQAVASTDAAAAAMSDVTNVAFRGADGYLQSNYWGVGTEIFGASNVNFVNVSWTGPTGSPPTNGTGLRIEGSGTFIPVQFNIFGCNFNNLQYGIYYGSWTEGISVSASNFVFCDNGIFVPAGLSDNLYQLTVVGSQFGCYGTDISMLTWVPYVTISGNVFNVSDNAVGLFMAQSYNFSIVGNVFITSAATPTNVQGISVTASNGIGGVITGNTFSNFINSGGAAVVLGASTSGINVQSNGYFGNANNVLNSGTGNTIGGGSP